MEPRSRQVLALFGWLAASFAAAGIGGLASIDAQAFYAALDKPVWAPPASLFGPVWTVLYFLMGLAAWLVWRERGIKRTRAALMLFAAQLAANALWSWLFFAWRLGGPAFAELVVLWLLVLATTIAFSRIKPLAGALLVPYLGWVAYAGCLNWALWRLNPTLIG